MLTLSDAEALLAEAEQDRKRAIDDAEVRYTSAVSAIREVMAIIARRGKQENQPQISSVARTMLTTPHLRWPGLRAAIRQSIDRRPAHFTLTDIMEDFGQLFPRQSINRQVVSSELWRLKKEGNIKLLEKGSGKTPNAYEKVNHSDTPNLEAEKKETA